MILRFCFTSFPRLRIVEFPHKLSGKLYITIKANHTMYFCNAEIHEEVLRYHYDHHSTLALYEWVVS